MKEFTDALLHFSKALGIALAADQLEQCAAYHRLVTQANKQFNLTRITNDEHAAEQHFAHAMMLDTLMTILPAAQVIDIGTGAGYPGVPLGILRPDISLTLVDASEKKTDFIRSATESLSLHANVICARAEMLARTQLRESFDVAVSRAVAALPMLLELCVPLLRQGGKLAAWKGESYQQEIDAASRALVTLGCRVISKSPVGQGALLLIEKQKPTPDIYPRRFSKIKSHPL